MAPASAEARSARRTGDLPSRALPRWQHLVTPAWLAALISGRAVVAPPAAAWRLFEVGCGGEASFAAGHVPEAGYLDTHRLERAPWWTKVADRELLQVLLDHGIRHDVTVVLYGRHPLCAARAAHLLLYAGVKDVRLLDGGFEAWRAARLPVTQGASRVPPPAADFGVTLPARPGYLLDTDQVRELVRRDDGTLVSIRTWDEFVGNTSGYAYIAAKGDIPGARWGHAGRAGDVHSMSDFHRPDGTMRPPGEIRAFWQAAGIHPGRRTVFYCGTAWRASLAFFYAWLMGWPRIGVYDGGWAAWSSHPGHPIAVGAPAGAGAGIDRHARGERPALSRRDLARTLPSAHAGPAGDRSLPPPFRSLCP